MNSTRPWAGCDGIGESVKRVDEAVPSRRAQTAILQCSLWFVVPRLAGMSRGDLRDLGESLDEGEAGLVVVAVSDMEAKVRSAMKRAQKS